LSFFLRVPFFLVSLLRFLLCSFFLFLFIFLFLRQFSYFLSFSINSILLQYLFFFILFSHSTFSYYYVLYRATGVAVNRLTLFRKICDSKLGQGSASYD
jgi:hypothetical protein